MLPLTLNAGASTGSVAVTVTDYNDETPEFIPSTLSTSVAEEALFGTTITTLRIRIKCMIACAVYNGIKLSPILIISIAR